MEVVVGGINYKSVAGVAAIGDSREVEAMAFEDTYNATSDNILYFKAGTKSGSTIAKDVFGYEGYQVGSSEKVEYAISDVDGVTFNKSTQLSGFYEYTENSKGYLELTKILYNTFADDEDSYLDDEVLDEIKNGILTWNSEKDSALVSGAVVVDLTDADKAAENTYGKNVTSVTTLSRILDNGYTVTVDLFSNKDNEVEAIFITNISGNPKPVDDDDVTEDTEATVNGKAYDDLDEALSEATENATITLTKNVVLNETRATALPEGVTLDGNGHTITYTGSKNGNVHSAIVLGDNCTVKDLTLVGDGIMSVWTGNFGIQAFNAKNVTVSDVTIKNFNAAILLNNADMTLTGTVDVSGNYYGGIEVNGTLIIEGALVNTTESSTAPTVWTGCDDVNGTDPAGTVTGGSMSKVVYKKMTDGETKYQIWWLKEIENDPNAKA